MLLLLLSRFSRVRLCATPETAAHQAPPSLGLSRQEHWSGLPFPSPVHQSEKWKWRRSVVSDSSLPHGLQPTRLLHPWDFPGKSTGVGVPSPSPTCMYSHSLPCAYSFYITKLLCCCTEFTTFFKNFILLCKPRISVNQITVFCQELFQNISFPKNNKILVVLNKQMSSNLSKWFNILDGLLTL